MSLASIQCIVQDDESVRKTIFASGFNELIDQINAKFNLDATRKYSILDKHRSEIDSNAFDGYKAAGSNILELFINQSNELQLYDDNGDNESISTNSPRELQLSNLKFELTILNSGSFSMQEMEIPNNYSLVQLNDAIISKINLENTKFVAFLYDSNGQPLSPNFYSCQFLKAHQVLSNEERVVVVVSNNCYASQLISTPSYARDFNIKVVDKTMNVSFKLKVNQVHDKDPEIKNLIGLSLGIPSTSIILVKKSDAFYQFYTIDHIPNLNLSLYNPVIGQSEEGLRMFRNFIYCLPSHTEDGERLRLLACIRYISPFNPFLHSFNLILSKIPLTESELVALDEGAIMLFQKLCIAFDLKFTNESLFEHTLDFFALLFELCNIESFKKGEAEVFDTKIISNPTKVVRPVIVKLSNDEQKIYDLSQIQELKILNKKIYKFEGSIDSLEVDKTLEKLIKRTVGTDRDELIIMKTVFDPLYDLGQLFRDGPKVTSHSDLEKLKCKRSVTQITSYLDLNESSNRKTLTYDLNKKIVVNFGLKECSYDILLKDIFTNTEISTNQEKLSEVLNRAENDSQAASMKQEIFSRIPEEAIAVLIDTSGSMDSKFIKTDKSRIAVTKDFFNSFINRSQGYNVPQILSLTTFDSNVKEISKFTENFYKFSKFLETIRADGGTSIFGAITSVIPSLIAIKQKFNDIRLRIVCFSDGEDSSSNLNDLLSKLISNKITLDCINLGYECTKLKNLSLCTGGFAFQFDTLEEGFRIFESDSFISLRFRNPSEIIPSATESDFNSKTFKSFTANPPPSIIPKQVSLKATNVASSLIAMDITRPKFDSSASSLRYKRIMREMALIHKNPHPDIKIFPCESDMQFWNGIISGPMHTPYEGGNFHIYISFPEEYPNKAPEIRFMTKIFHINVNSSGRICISILNSDYAPEIRVLRLLESIYGILMCPEDSDALDTNTATMFRSSRSNYDNVAREWTNSFAMKPVTEIFQGMSSEELQNDVPVEYVCALTKKIMNEPVTCRTSGKTYERKVIEDFISQNGCDPITKQPTKLTKLFAETSLQGNIKRFLALNA